MSHLSDARRYKWKTLRLVVHVLLLCGSAVSARTHDPSPSAKATSTDEIRCGPNSLLAFLILLGRKETTLEEIGDIHLDHGGASLLSLRDAARRLGVATEIRHYRLEELDFLPLPAIVLFANPGKGTGGNHFVVIYKVD